MSASADISSAMSALLDALSEADAATNPMAAAAVAVKDEDPALEGKLKELMRALNQNNRDDWAGKPVQEPLPFDFKPKPEEDNQVEVVRVAGAPSGSLDGLLGDYMRELKKLRQLEREDQQETGTAEASTATATSAAAAGGNPYGNLSLGELLDALDDFPMPPKPSQPAVE